MIKSEASGPGNLPTYRDPAVILIDQLKKSLIVGEVDILDTLRWYPRAIAGSLM